MSCSTHWRVERALLALTLCLGWAGAVNALSAGGSTAQQAVASTVMTSAAVPLVDGHLQGEATMRFWGLSIYRARLWTRPDFQAAEIDRQPMVLELEYLRDFKGSAIAKRSLQEMQGIDDIAQPQAQRWLAQMRDIFPDVAAGDRLSGFYQPGRGVSFQYNGRAVGQITDADFGRLFFGIWLDPKTSEPAMRLALLGLKAPDQR